MSNNNIKIISFIILYCLIVSPSNMIRNPLLLIGMLYGCSRFCNTKVVEDNSESNHNAIHIALSIGTFSSVVEVDSEIKRVSVRLLIVSLVLNMLCAGVENDEIKHFVEVSSNSMLLASIINLL